MLSAGTIVTWVSYTLSLGVIGKIFSDVIPVENFVHENIFLIHFEIRAFYKILEARVRSPNSSLQRRVLGDLAKVYYSPVLYELFFVETPDMYKFLLFLPKLFIIELSIYAISEETFDWVYKSNKVTRVLINLLFAFLMVDDLIVSLEHVGKIPLALLILEIDLAEAWNIGQVNVIEDFILVKWSKVKESVNFQGLLTDLYTYFCLNAVTLTILLVKMNKNSLVSEGIVVDTCPENEESCINKMNSPCEIFGYDLDMVAKWLYMLILFMATWDVVQRAQGEKGVLYGFRSFFPNMTNFKYKVAKAKAKKD